jgi:hypothetical protein
MAKSRRPKVAQSNTKSSADPTNKRVTRNERPPEPARIVPQLARARQRRGFRAVDHPNTLRSRTHVSLS